MDCEDKGLLGLQSLFDKGCVALEQSKTLTLLMSRAFDERRPAFRSLFTFEQRAAESRKQLRKYPARIPIVVEDDPRQTTQIRAADAKRKFLVPRDMTFGDFMYTIRARAKLEAHQAMFLFVEREDKDGNKSTMLPPIGVPVGTLYDHHRDHDGFVYLVCATENVFG